LCNLFTIFRTHVILRRFPIDSAERSRKESSMVEVKAPARRRRLGAHGMMFRRRRIFARLREGWTYEEIANGEGVTITRIRLLGGAMNLVNGIGTLRNRLSDSHGPGGKPVRPSPRHASLAVNLAGGVATFLVETFSLSKRAKALS
jgi:hypothetical protein